MSDRAKYTYPGGNPRNRTPIDYQRHGHKLHTELNKAYKETLHNRPVNEQLENPQGAYYEFTITNYNGASKVSKKRLGMQTGAVKINEGREATLVVFIPDAAIEVLEQLILEYQNDECTPAKKEYAERITSIRRGRLQTFWTDDTKLLPEDPKTEAWWELWLEPKQKENLVKTTKTLGLRIAEQDWWQEFPETLIIPVYGRRIDIELLTVFQKGLTELRRGTDTPDFFLDEERHYQHEWVLDLAERTNWPNLDAPSVCILDTGVNRAHPLIEPALSVDNLHAWHPDWTATDNPGFAHGTGMAGLALHGDLFPKLAGTEHFNLDHRAESVRILPPTGFPENEPTKYGPITEGAVAIAETAQPDVSRVFCISTTNTDVTGHRNSSWSASIDRLAYGSTIGDQHAAKRLLFVAVGNKPAPLRLDQYEENKNYPIEDPAQAWNSIAVGGYTDKQTVNGDGLDGYNPMVGPGEVSPHSRNSLAWSNSSTPIKPEIVLEAGNRAQNGTNAITCESLDLITTNGDTAQPLTNFNGTSAATALASRLAARIQAHQKKSDLPEYWPETVRALIVHSAGWTQHMWNQLEPKSMTNRKYLARQFGYGIPSFERAIASAQNDLALIAENEIQPFVKKESGTISLNECHYYELPWPKKLLQEHGEHNFELKVTLSYFIEPNPGRDAAVNPQNYQSHGLRFDLKRPKENTRIFRKRNNADAPGGKLTGEEKFSDEGWVFGTNSVSAGSIHCDVWRGSGAQLASRDMICVKPISGWWKARSKKAVCEQTARYSLIVTLSSPGLDIDLYTPIQNSIAPLTEIIIGT